MTQNNRRVIRRSVRISLLLCICLVLAANLAYPVYADTARASDMRLQAVEGTVTVLNGSGKEVSVRDSMKLYSGYSLQTGGESCAYISLDSDKLVKLDADSQVELRKDGEKLELLLASGQLLFNITKPLADSESLNIRTSTMVTGIRGTSGYVQVLPGDNWAVTILDGAVALSSVRSDEAVTLPAGNTACSLEAEIVVGEIEADTIPSFVVLELQRDEALRLRVEQDCSLNVDELIAALPQRLEAEQNESWPTSFPSPSYHPTINPWQAPQGGSTTPVPSPTGGSTTPAPSPTGGSTDSSTTPPPTDSSTDSSTTPPPTDSSTTPQPTDSSTTPQPSPT